MSDEKYLQQLAVNNDMTVEEVKQALNDSYFRLEDHLPQKLLQPGAEWIPLQPREDTFIWSDVPLTLEEWMGKPVKQQNYFEKLIEGGEGD